MALVNAIATRRASLPLTDQQRQILRVLSRPRTTDEVATACGLSRDGARASLMALSSKGRIIHHRGKPARWERA